jgi:hypothetical protein
VDTTKTFDPTIMEQFAGQLLRKADSVRVGSAIVGGVVGVIFGAVPLTPLASVWPIPAIFGFATILLGALAGVLVGYVVGEGRAFRLRVQAQTALFQVDIERSACTGGACRSGGSSSCGSHSGSSRSGRSGADRSSAHAARGAPARSARGSGLGARNRPAVRYRLEPR